MLASRLLGGLLLFLSFGFLAVAGPVGTSELAVRDLDVDDIVVHPALVRRDGTGNDILAALIDLESQLQVSINKTLVYTDKNDLKVKLDCACKEILAAIEAAIAIILAIKLSVVVAADLVLLIAIKLAAIIGLLAVFIVKAIIKLKLSVIHSIDVILCKLIKAIILLIPGLLIVLKIEILKIVTIVIAVPLVLVLKLCLIVW